jgi:hypothetical protein
LLSTLRSIGWSDQRYRGTRERYRRNHPRAFKRALDSLVAKGYADRRDFEPGYLERLPLWERMRPRRPRWQYRPTANTRSVMQKVNTYPETRLTTEHSPHIEAAIDAAMDRICLEAGIPILRNR